MRPDKASGWFRAVVGSFVVRSNDGPDTRELSMSESFDADGDHDDDDVDDDDDDQVDDDDDDVDDCVSAARRAYE